MSLQPAHLNQAVSGAGGPLSRTFLFARIAAIGAAIAGAVPTANTLYQSWSHGIPYTEVSHRLAQYDLWVKNFECKIDYRALNTGQGTRIDVGACPKSGDIAIKISAQSGKATYEWIPYTKLQKASASLWQLDLLIGTAHASQDGKPAQPGHTVVAQGTLSPPPAAKAPAPEAQPRPSGPPAQATSGMQVVCEALQSKTLLVRVVNDAGKCFREQISPYQGKVDKRDEVPCNTTCQAGGAAAAPASPGSGSAPIKK